MDDIEQTIINILAEQAMCDPAQIEGHMTIEALGLDSLGLVEARSRLIRQSRGQRDLISHRSTALWPRSRA